MIICGDFNFGEISWASNDVERIGQVLDARNFLDSINDSFLHQHVLVDTHNLDGDNPTNLDLVFTRDPGDVSYLELLSQKMILTSPNLTLAIVDLKSRIFQWMWISSRIN